MMELRFSALFKNNAFLFKLGIQKTYHVGNETM